MKQSLSAGIAILAVTAGLSLLPFSLSSKTNLSRLWPQMKQNITKSGIEGFGIFYRIPGQWHGSVSSDTPAGNFPVWYVDFRPTGPSQISELSTVDPSMNNYITFFIVKHEGRMRVAMRTDALYENKGCITYEVLIYADESKGYYKFADFQSGNRRAWTEFTFKEDSLVMRTYTNKFNKQKNLTLHTEWKARRGDISSSIAAIKHFSYPQPVIVKDFSTVFGNRHESVFFTRKEDPHSSVDEPYVGSVRFNITIDKKLKVSPKDELMVMLTTKPIFVNMQYHPERMKYLSKLMYLPIKRKSYTVTHIHPGKYWVYSYNDINQDRRHKSGDYIASKLNHAIYVRPEKTITVNTHIDMVIP